MYWYLFIYMYFQYTYNKWICQFMSVQDNVNDDAEIRWIPSWHHTMVTGTAALSTLKWNWRHLGPILWHLALGRWPCGTMWYICIELVKVSILRRPGQRLCPTCLAARLTVSPLGSLPLHTSTMQHAENRLLYHF